MTTNQVKNYYESEAEEDHSSDSDYVEELSYSESENEYDVVEYELAVEHNEPTNENSYYNIRRKVAPKPDAHTIEIMAIKNNITKEMREKKEKKKSKSKKMTKVRGYKRVRISDGVDWTSSMDPHHIRTRSEYKRFREEQNIHEDMLAKLEADGHLLRCNDDESLILCK
jgi:hypothetical protein